MNWTYVWVGLIAVVWKGFFVLLLMALKKKFIPASDYISAIEVARRLQNEGFTPTINLLGDNCIDREKVEQTFKQYLYLVDALDESGIKGKISVKPTQLGLAISKKIYCDRIWRLSRRAHNQKILLEIDIESLNYLDDTLEVFRKIPKEYNVRQTIAVCLERSKKDVEELINQHLKVRLVKGAYTARDLSKSETQKQMKNLATQLLLRGIELAIVTAKDEELINNIFELVSQRDTPKNRFAVQVSKNSFIIQTLYGVRDDLKRKWRDEGFRVEVYVPVGPWHKALPYIWQRILKRF